MMNIIREECLTYFDPEKNSNKYYEVKIVKMDEYELISNWGRIGCNGATKIKKFSNEALAIRALDTIVNNKVKKGYTKKDIIVNKTGNLNINKLDNSNISLSTIDINIANFVNEVYATTKNHVSHYMGVKNDIVTPIGNLGINGINKGREILQNIANATDINNIKKYSKEYFKYIPRKMSSKISDNEWILDTDEKINKEMEILDLYEDALNILTKNINTIDAKYEAMNCEINNVTNDEMDYIKNKIATTHASNHHYTLKVLNAFKIDQLNAPKFDDSIGNNVHLFHGTRTENLLGILSSNLKLPNTLNNVVKTGAMFGPGLYFANNCTKSANYSFGFWNGKKVNRAYIFICEVALGNVYEVNDSNYFNKAPNGYNSVKGCKGPHLYNNEFIVYNENQVKIKYIVEVEKC